MSAAVSQIENMESETMTDAAGSNVRKRRRIGGRALEVTGLGLGTAPLGGLYRDLSD